MVAAHAGHTNVVELLMARGANASLKTKSGGTALQLAEKGGHSNLVQILKKQAAR
jgi:ankyrin repeat protein